MIIQHSSNNGGALMALTARGQLVALTLAGFGVALAGSAFCIVQIYKTAQLPLGDGTGMQWVILTPLTMLFLLVVVPALLTGMRGLRLMKLARQPRPSPVADRRHADGAAGRDQAAQATEIGFGEAGGSEGTES